ncbi:pirin family protein [Bacillus xiapuensis]|uniref:pirin family protein n=1 Tax=Bacillus xiapuensis TaxID=2014075 RepID=UPI000C2391FB|nr:pirin family protein [Bacillus xiapuensis]
MIDVYPAQSRYSADRGWLRSNFSFSFADYYDPNNMSFGPMRVLNDDWVAPKRGFGMHPHAEMEIVSIVLQGQLEHRDSNGHTAVTSFGGVQRMSAGTGIHHSEMNPSEKEEVNFLQLWFIPDEAGLPPSYEKTVFDTEKMKNQLLPIVTKHPEMEGVAHIHQNLTIYVSELDTKKTIQFEQAPGRRIFLFILEGAVTVNDDTSLNKRDSARIMNVSTLTVKAVEPARFMLIDLP